MRSGSRFLITTSRQMIKEEEVAGRQNLTRATQTWEAYLTGTLEKEGNEDSGNYSKKPFSRARIIERINRFINESEGGDMDEISYHLNRNDDLNRDLALTLLEKKDGVPGASELAKICKALFGHIHRNSTIYRS